MDRRAAARAVWTAVEDQAALTSMRFLSRALPRLGTGQIWLRSAALRDLQFVDVDRCRPLRAVACREITVPEQEFFASFFQKRTAFLAPRSTRTHRNRRYFPSNAAHGYALILINGESHRFDVNFVRCSILICGGGKL
jgi:hypothetical protein